MRSWLLFPAVVVALVADAAGAKPLAADPSKPVVFWPPAIGSLDSGFRPDKDKNRVFYVGSRKQTHVWWTKYTNIAYDPEYNFKKYGVLAIFYKGQAAGFRAGFDPKIDYIEESAAGELSAKVTITCYNATSCRGAQADPSHPWGIMILVLIVKRSLLVPPKTVQVTTASA
jgi:hypothetical protein